MRPALRGGDFIRPAKIVIRDYGGCQDDVAVSSDGVPIAACSRRRRKFRRPL